MVTMMKGMKVDEAAGQNGGVYLMYVSKMYVPLQNKATLKCMLLNLHTYIEKFGYYLK